MKTRAEEQRPSEISSHVGRERVVAEALDEPLAKDDVGGLCTGEKGRGARSRQPDVQDKVASMRVSRQNRWQPVVSL